MRHIVLLLESVQTERFERKVGTSLYQPGMKEGACSC